MEVQEMEDWERRLDDELKQEKQKREEQAKKQTEQTEAIKANEKKAAEFLAKVVYPVLKGIADGLNKRDIRTIVMEPSDRIVSLEIKKDAPGPVVPEFIYNLSAQVGPRGSTLLVRYTDGQAYNLERRGAELRIEEITEKDIQDDFADAYIAYRRGQEVRRR
jgi:hypothetical protein